MILISHRGNINGESKFENSPHHIDTALSLGYNVEIDVWDMSGNLFLGHDYPQYNINLEYLKNDSFWCHAKNLEALEVMLKNDIRCFWHQEDDFTLTSDNHIWTYPLKDVTNKSIIVCKTLGESIKYSTKDIYGVCSDYVSKIQEIQENLK
jgi:hypothetical protein